MSILETLGINDGGDASYLTKCFEWGKKYVEWYNAKHSMNIPIVLKWVTQCSRSTSGVYHYCRGDKTYYISVTVYKENKNMVELVMHEIAHHIETFCGDNQRVYGVMHSRKYHEILFDLMEYTKEWGVEYAPSRFTKRATMMFGSTQEQQELLPIFRVLASANSPDS